MRRLRLFDPAAVEAEVDRIRSLGIAALRARWRLMFGGSPPAGLSKDIIKRLMAYRIQEDAFGGLDRETKRLLGRLARGGKARVEFNRRLKPGAILVREYQGTRHTVTVVPNGFSWQGETYTSLSTIARAITGTAWNGPRFFGLREAGQKQVDGSAMPSVPFNPSPPRIPTRGRIDRGPTFEEALALRDLHAQVDRA
jgi:hypothetical protein